nr:WRKY transcription factor 26 [Manihot esculenta]
MGFSPGPMTLVSSFFSDSDDFKSFSQLLAGAMASPAANTNNNKLPFPPPQQSKNSLADVSKPANLSIVPPSPMFNLPPGLSPMALLDSPGFGLLSPQGSFGMTHQQALAQVTAQAVHAHSSMHIQAQYSSSLPSAQATSSTQFSSVTTNSTTLQQMLPSIPDPSDSIKESSDFTHSDQRSQAYSLGDKPNDDGYNWRKYGQKQVKGSEFPRSYYKCTHPSCPVKKKVERSLDGQVTEIIYKGQHNHQPPQPNKRVKDAGSLKGNSDNQNNSELASQIQVGKMNKSKDRKDQESSQATPELVSGTSDSEEVGDTETAVDENDEDEPNPKRRNTEVKVTEPASSHRTVTEPRIIVQTTSEVDLLDDGYRWRKYGQKVVKGNPYPRSYYKCTTSGCTVRKHVERAATDPRAVITTYEGKHNHDVPAAKGSSHGTTSSNPSERKQQNVEKHSLDNRRDFGTNNQQPIARLRLKEEQIT